MLLQTAPTEVPTIEETFVEFVAGIVATIPRLIAGLLFLLVAYAVIRAIRFAVRSVLERVYPADQELVVSLFVAILNVFLWFAAALALLEIVGLGEIAASLGTAAGFIGLGIAFALKEMIADTVAGVYLLRDPDFNEGYLVETADVTGTVTGIDLRKTRLRTAEDELIVLANREVEAKWTKDPAEDEPEPGAGAAPDATDPGEETVDSGTGDTDVSGTDDIPRRQQDGLVRSGTRLLRWLVRRL